MVVVAINVMFRQPKSVETRQTLNVCGVAASMCWIDFIHETSDTRMQSCRLFSVGLRKQHLSVNTKLLYTVPTKKWYSFKILLADCMNVRPSKHIKVEFCKISTQYLWYKCINNEQISSSNCYCHSLLSWALHRVQVTPWSNFEQCWQQTVHNVKTGKWDKKDPQAAVTHTANTPLHLCVMYHWQHSHYTLASTNLSQCYVRQSRLF